MLWVLRFAITFMLGWKIAKAFDEYIREGKPLYNFIFVIILTILWIIYALNTS